MGKEHKRIMSDMERKLVTDNIKYACKSALAYRGKGVEYDDLVQEACEAMCYAAMRFNPKCEVKFTTFATKYINGRLAQFIMKYGMPSYLNYEQRVFIKILSLDKPVECDGELVRGSEFLRSDWDGGDEERLSVFERLDKVMQCLNNEERELVEARYAFSGDKDSFKNLRKKKYNKLSLSQLYRRSDFLINKIRLYNF